MHCAWHTSEPIDAFAINTNETANVAGVANARGFLGAGSSQGDSSPAHALHDQK
jgi:hypothetical protein